MRDALIAGSMIALTFGLLGVFVVLRRVVFIGMTVAQVASAGTAFSFFLAAWAGSLVSIFASPWWHHWGDIITSSLFTLFAVFVIARSSKGKLIPSDAIVGLAFSAAWAMGILFVANSGQGIAEVRNLVQGDLLLVCTHHLVIIAAVTMVTWAILLTCWKDHVLIAFDPAMARALGYESNRWDLIFYALLGLAVVAGIRFAGLLLIFTYLVVPPLAGLFLGRSTASMAVISVSTALIATSLGLGASFHWDLPASPLISIFCVAIALMAALLKRMRE